MGSYCGKICAECMRKEELNCNGCKEWQSSCNEFCEIAKCCKSKFHDACETCGNVNVCSKYSQRNNVPDNVLNLQRIAEAEKTKIALHAPILKKCFSVMFWLIIPQLTASFLSLENVNYPITVNIIGVIIIFACALIYGLMLIKAAQINDDYRLSAIVIIISGALAAISSILQITRQIGNASLLLTIPAAILTLIGEYREFHTHADVIEKYDNEISDKWRKLWKLEAISIAASVGGVVFIIIAPVLGLLIVLAGMILTIVVGVKKLIYLYKSAEVFKNFI